MSKPIQMERGVKYRDADKMALIPVKTVAVERQEMLRKPEWMKIKLPADTSRIQGIKAAMRKNGLHSVCEEASCPNLAECFNHGTATFMILGAICTRRCPFCDVAHGRPNAPDANEPAKLAQTIADMGLRYVVITSVDRDDLRDGGAQHFADCISAIREKIRRSKSKRWCRTSVAVWIARWRFSPRRHRMCLTTIWKTYRASTARCVRARTMSGH